VSPDSGVEMRRIEIDIGEQRIPFRYPFTPNMHGMVQNIFSDKTYPRLAFIADSVDLVMDIGANIGTASLYLSQCYPKARIFSYEPAKRTYNLLYDNTAALVRITPIRAALSDRDGSAEFLFGGLGGETSSLHANYMTDGGTSETVELRDAGKEFARVAGEARFPVLKLDTEGAELAILTSIGPALDRVAALYLEYHSETDRIAIDRMMVEAGHVLYAIHAAHPYRGEATYVRKKLLDELTTLARYIVPHP